MEHGYTCRLTATGAGGMNREEAPGKSPEEMYVQQKVRVLLMLKKMGSNLTPSEEAFLRNYAGVVHSQMSQLPQHPIEQGAEDGVMAFSRSETEDRRHHSCCPNCSGTPTSLSTRIFKQRYVTIK
ncbi:hypothetical protein JZ751_017747 [Albula glossodonta]|uniref:Beta-catenin-interacting protein 1 n=1 Tax=Albula glossodonta TaxID=121402 RepID=A0A8T2PP98_9TELE|nr:hypothetical protein JZ751_017747 [Albula glossodonta]